ncbi:ClbS/DfsB family four-helix bundle protein [Aliiroseovarius sp.]|uniref:ClbS/DfsB family four-helix bundle protein n=1 Tax=Aliiroseovarius sp. TaxID=1872442 RepID=UPI003BAC2B13
MPAATSKAEIIAITEKEWAKLTTLLDKVDEALATRPLDDGVTIKDTVAHRAHWTHLFLGWYADGQAGREVHFPAKGYKWNQLKPYNAMLRERHAGLSWAEARANLDTSHAALMDFYATHSDEDLYAGPMKGANNAWTPGRWSESAGASHYRSAAKWIRACLRSA